MPSRLIAFLLALLLLCPGAALQPAFAGPIEQTPASAATAFDDAMQCAAQPAVDDFSLFDAPPAGGAAEPAADQPGLMPGPLRNAFDSLLLGWLRQPPDALHQPPYLEGPQRPPCSLHPLLV